MTVFKWCLLTSLLLVLAKLVYQHQYPWWACLTPWLAFLIVTALDFLFDRILERLWPKN